MELKKYYQLPDSMASEDLAILFKELLDLPQEKNCFGVLEIAEALDQLADRQWHTYSEVDVTIKANITEWLKSNWSKESLELTELVTSIIAKLGLSECIPMLKFALRENLPPSVRKELLEALAEYEKNVSDPYSGLR